MKRYLVIGASGLVGEHLVNSLIENGQEIKATYHTTQIPDAEQLDLRQLSDVITLIKKSEPSIVFLPAALTNVDYCESHPEQAHRINVAGVKNVVEASNSINAKLIYFSTDYIFDGTDGPYNEMAPANPINEYGRQKLIAEHYISLFAKNYLIIRTTVVYGWEHQEKNFVFRLINSLKQGKTIQIPKDQIGTPTYAPDLAHKAITLANMDVKGVINLTGKDCISRYEFARNVADIFNLSSNLIIPVSTSELKQPAKRPLLAGLKTYKAQHILQDPFLSSRDGLNLMLKDSASLIRRNRNQLSSKER